MGNLLPTLKNNSSTEEETPRSSASANSCRQENIEMVQNVLLIWLDNNINDKSADCRNTTLQLRRVINTVNKYTKGVECIKFLKSIKDEKACMIISGSLGEDVVPVIHTMPQVDSIFIFCRNKEYHQAWANRWSKIKGVFTEITPICDALKQAARQCEHNAISMSFVPANNDVSNKNLNQLDSSFMYTQIFKEILLTIQFEKEHFTEFIEHCREKLIGNVDELKNVELLAKRYQKKTPVWWYSYECFMYPMLNRALRTMDVVTIIKMGFFIRDLHRQIDELHSKQFKCQQSTSKSFIVYRGQGMSNTDFEKMSKTKGGLMSFNNFLSTTKDRNIALEFAGRALADPDALGILFTMTIDPSKSTTPFALIADVSSLPAEHEILFSTHTVFRISDIKPMCENHRLYQVDLILTCNDDKDLSALTDRMREETKGPSGWYRLGELLRKVGQFDLAQVVFISILNRGTDDNEKAAVFNQLGRIKNIQGEPKEAIAMYEKSLALYGKIFPSNSHHLAWPYNNIGLVYQSLRDYPKALSFYLKALEIRQHSLSSRHPDIASSYNNIGVLYAHMHEYNKALINFQKAHEIKEKTLPANHPELAYSYDNIGSVYSSMHEYVKALPYHEKAFNIFNRALPSNHPDVAKSFNNIAVVYENMGEYSKARIFYEKAVEIGKQSLPSNNSSLLQWQKNLENLRSKSC